MSQGQMQDRKMSLWQLESVQDGPRNLTLKFGQNRVSNSWDIADVEFLWDGGVVCTVILRPTSNYIEVRLSLSWGCDNSVYCTVQEIDFCHAVSTKHVGILKTVQLPNSICRGSFCLSQQWKWKYSFIEVHQFLKYSEWMTCNEVITRMILFIVKDNIV